MKLDRRINTLFVALLAPIHSLAIQLNPTVNGVDGSNNIQSPGQIKVSWVVEPGDPSGFDIDLVHSDGTHGLIRPNIELDWGEVVLTLPSGLPDGQYANGIYVNGYPILVKGPNFYIGSQPKSTTTTPIPQIVTIKTTISEPPPTKTTTISGSSTTSTGRPSAILSGGPLATNSSTIIYGHTSSGQIFTSSDIAGSSSSPGPTSATTSSSVSRVPVGIIAGAIAGALVLIIALALVILVLRRRRRKELNRTTHALMRIYSKPKSERTYTAYPEPPSSTYEDEGSIAIRENHELKERIQALEYQQEALVNRLLINGAMPPDYHDGDSFQPPPIVLPSRHRLSFHKNPI